MGAREHVRDRIVEHDRHAVGGQHGQHRARIGRDQSVGAGYGVGAGPGAAAPIRPADHLGRHAVHLLGENGILQGGPEGGHRPAPVLQHVGGIVANVQAEVQAGVGPGGHPAAAGRHQHVHVEATEGGPGQHVEARKAVMAGYLAEHGRGGRGRDHRERA